MQIQTILMNFVRPCSFVQSMQLALQLQYSPASHYVRVSTSRPCFWFWKCRRVSDVSQNRSCSQYTFGTHSDCDRNVPHLLITAKDRAWQFPSGSAWNWGWITNESRPLTNIFLLQNTVEQLRWIWILRKPSLTLKYVKKKKWFGFLTG